METAKDTSFRPFRFWKMFHVIFLGLFSLGSFLGFASLHSGPPGDSYYLLKNDGSSCIHNDWIINIVFSPCGRYLVTVSRDSVIKIWDVRYTVLLAGKTTYPCTYQFDCLDYFDLLRREGRLSDIDEDAWVVSMAWFCDGAVIALGCNNGNIILLNVVWHDEMIQGIAVKSVLEREKNGEVRLAASRNRLFAGDGSNAIDVWEFDQALGYEKSTISLPLDDDECSHTKLFNVSPNDCTLALNRGTSADDLMVIASDNGPLSEKQWVPLVHSSYLMPKEISWSSTGLFLAASFYNNQVYVWRVNHQNEPIKIYNVFSTNIALSPSISWDSSGRYLCIAPVGEESMCVIYDVFKETERPIADSLVDCARVVWSPDGLRVAFLVDSSRSVRVVPSDFLFVPSFREIQFDRLFGQRRRLGPYIR